MIRNILISLLTLFINNLYSQKINQDFKIHPKKIDEKIKIDGLINENEWKNADVAKNFFMITPVDGKKAQQESEVRILYDEKYIYFGIVFFNNSTQGDYAVESLRRDFSFNKNDNLLIAIDPFNNQTTGFTFGLNAYGAQWDGTMYDGGRVDLNWDTKWVSEVTFDKDKWICEISIPLKSIRYKEGVSEWGINFGRLDLKANEKSSWAPVPRQFPSVSLAYTGVLVWDEPPPKQGKNISVIPYSLLNKNQDKENTNKIGGDFKMNFSSSLNLDLTINPDFSQVEVDQQITDLDRFELFYPEKRQFFLENADLFANFGYKTIRPFFSRRIGLGVPIEAGLRLSGNINEKWRIGLMNIQTQSLNEINLPKQNFGVFTIQKKVFDRSSLGLMFINKESLSDSKKINNSNYSKYNRSLGIEYNYASIDNLWQGKILMLKTFTDNFDNNKNSSLASHLEYNSTNWKWRIQQEFIGEDFNAEVGYVPRKGFLKLSSSIGYLFYEENSKIISHGPKFSRTLYLDKDYKKTDLINELSYLINYKDRSSLKIDFTTNFVKLLDDFDPIKSNIKSLSKGSDHKWNYLSLEYLSNQQKKLTYKFEGIIGGYYQNGKRKGFKNFNR